MWTRKLFFYNGTEYYVTITECVREEWYRRSKPSYIDYYHCVIEEKRNKKKWYQKSWIKIGESSFNKNDWFEKYQNIAKEAINQTEIANTNYQQMTVNF